MANAHLEVEPDRVIKEVKRDMGTDKTYSLAGNEHTPQGISSMILKNLFKTLKNKLVKSIQLLLQCQQILETS